MHKLTVMVLVWLVVAPDAQAQEFHPSSARAWSYIPQLASGGGWSTRITISNASSRSVEGDIWFLDDEGEELALELDDGFDYTWRHFAVPARGAIVLLTAADAPQLTTGWAIIQAEGPVSAVSTFRLSQNGSPRYDVSIPASLPTSAYITQAVSGTGIALGNIYSAGPVRVEIEINEPGTEVRTTSVTLPPNGHRAFFIREIFSGLSPSFLGMVHLHSNNNFAVAALEERDGVISSLPSGNVARPLPHFSVLQDIFHRMTRALETYDDFPNPETVNLTVQFNGEFNAYGGSDGVIFDVALSQLFADSESEIAWVMGHELGHVYQFRTGKLDFNNNRELDADVWGLILALDSGYDPYASAGALAKMNMVLGSADLSTQHELQNQYFSEILYGGGAGTEHGSFNQRLQHQYHTINAICDIEDLKAACAQYRQIFHPNFQDSVPLFKPPGEPPGE